MKTIVLLILLAVIPSPIRWQPGMRKSRQVTERDFLNLNAAEKSTPRVKPFDLRPEKPDISPKKPIPTPSRRPAR